MRPSHNWLSYWLPLVLFAWVATALAAQTWTTVWTPDSASATKATTKDATHESKTNCYPCKEWEDYGGGKGRWVDLDDVAPAECPTPTSHARRQTAEADSLPDHLNPCKTCKAGEVANKPDYTPCGTCGCCENGKCIEYPNNCPNPRPVPTIGLNKTGDCPCTDPAAGGCVIPELMPIPPPMPGYSVCIHNCNWVPVLESFTIDYKEGLCLDRCVNLIASADDVTPGNVCAVKKAIEDRINAIATPSPLIVPPPDEGDPDKFPPVEFCFTSCMQAHEDTHVEQLKEVWQKFWDSIYFSVYPMAVPFNCDNMRTAKQAKAAFADRIGELTVSEYFKFIAEWHTPNQGEQDAYWAEAQRLQDLLAQIQQLAIDNGCP